MGVKNAYAKKIAAAKSALKLETQKNDSRLKIEERRELIHHLITTVYQASAIALHNDFGFGKDRIERFCAALNSTILEYGVWLSDTDVDYADGKLDEAYQKIMNGQKRGSP